MIADFAAGMVLGLGVAAPVGPIGLLCIRRTLEHGFWAGVAGGAGTALADGLYAALAAFGIGAVTAILTAAQRPLQVVAIAALLWLAVGAWRQKPGAEIAPSSHTSVFAQTFLLTLANPATILTFAAMFAGFAAGDAASATALVAGTFAGSLLWWIVLSGTVAALRRRLTPRALLWINRAAAAMFVGFAVLVALRL